MRNPLQKGIFNRLAVCWCREHAGIAVCHTQMWRGQRSSLDAHSKSGMPQCHSIPTIKKESLKQQRAEVTTVSTKEFQQIAYCSHYITKVVIMAYQALVMGCRTDLFSH